MKKIFSGILFTLLIFFFLSEYNQLQASENSQELSTETQISYELLTDQSVKITNVFKLTNTRKKFQNLREYEIFTGNLFPSDIQVSSSQVAFIKYTLSYLNNKYTIKITFNDIKLNQNDSFSFNISYKIKSLVKGNNNIAIISLPTLKIPNANITDIEFSYPSAYNQIINSTINYEDLPSDNSYKKIKLSSIEYPFTPIYIIIGEKQYIYLNYTNKINNDSSEFKSVEIPFPHNDCNQDIIIDYMYPIPIETISDDLNNQLLKFYVQSGQSTNIQYTLTLLLNNNKCQNIPKSSLNSNLKNDKIIELLNKNIFKNSEYTTINKAQAIYNYLNLKVEINTANEQFNLLDDSISILNGNIKKLSIPQINKVFLLLLQNAGIKSYLNWGVVYPYYSNKTNTSDSTNYNAHTYSWITFLNDDNTSLIIDLPFEKSTSINGFNINLIDRISIYTTNNPDDEKFNWNDSNFKISLGNQEKTGNLNVNITCNTPKSIIAKKEVNFTCEIENTGNTIIDNLNITKDPEKILFSNDRINNGENLLSHTAIFPGQKYKIYFTTNLGYSDIGNFESSILFSYKTNDKLAHKEIAYEIKVKNNPIIITFAVLSILTIIVILGLLIKKKIKTMRYLNKKEI